MRSFITRQALKHRQLLLYGIIGLMGATLDFIIYALIVNITPIPPAPASFLSVSIGICNNFILNARHNFKITGKMLHRFISFYAIGVGGAILSSLIIFVLYNGFGVNDLVAKAVTIPPVVLLQFILNKKVSFSDKGYFKIK